MLWSGGLESIFSAPSLNDTSGVQATGVSAMGRYGVDLITRTNYYYCAYWEPELKVEDIALHTLLVDAHDVRGIIYSILVLKKAGFDRERFMGEARRVGIEELAKEVVSFIVGKEVTYTFLPSRSDMEEYYAQYEVQ